MTQTASDTRVNGATATSGPDVKTKACEQCRQPYRPAKPEQRFCKTACRSAFWNAKKASVEDTARLLAAAPDLLAALKRAREALKAFEDISGTWDLYQHSPEMKAINAAIAKAEGRA